mmetsp:Transcript_1817/g.6115  ORF Transcript_1817/g.6115 Transcript_1817/m.6115 type:complete len:471 (+) Transcript_1817:2976-4388(+)
MAAARPVVVELLLRHLQRSPHILLCRQEDQHVAPALAPVDRHGRVHRLRYVRVGGNLGVEDLNVVQGPFDGDGGCPSKKRGKGLRVNRGGGDHNPKVLPPPSDLLQQAQHEVGGQGPLMSFIDHHHAVARQQRVHVQQAEQGLVGGVLDPRGRPALIAPGLVARQPVPDLPAQLRVAFLCHALGHAHHHELPGLGAQHSPAVFSPAALVQELGDLRGLAAPGVANDDDDGVLFHQVQDLAPVARDRKRHAPPSLAHAPISRVSGAAGACSVGWGAQTRRRSITEGWHNKLADLFLLKVLGLVEAVPAEGLNGESGQYGRDERVRAPRLPREVEPVRSLDPHVLSPGQELFLPSNELGTDLLGHPLPPRGSGHVRLEGGGRFPAHKLLLQRFLLAHFLSNLLHPKAFEVLDDGLEVRVLRELRGLGLGGVQQIREQGVLFLLDLVELEVNRGDERTHGEHHERPDQELAEW